MRFDANTTDQAILKEIGERIAGVRLNKNFTQADLAEQAGVLSEPLNGWRLANRFKLPA